jgi:hypothetical protein
MWLASRVDATDTVQEAVGVGAKVRRKLLQVREELSQVRDVKSHTSCLRIAATAARACAPPHTCRRLRYELMLLDTSVVVVDGCLALDR